MAAIASPVSVKASPFLKWAGGKSALMPQLEPLFPSEFKGYHEPFLGGGAVFFHLQPLSAHLSDLNPRLIDCYLAIRDDVEEVIERLARLKRYHSKSHYYECRKRLNRDAGLCRTERAALQVYLNKTCYNGLYRENRRGHFNVPLGRYKNPSIFSEENLRSVSRLLLRAQLHCEPFESVLVRARAGDFVYFDPPYAPISETSNFTAFTRFDFDAFDQRRLVEVCRELDRRGCRFMVSNSSVPLIRRLYRGFQISAIESRRRINSKATRRGPVAELVIRNY